MSQWRKSTQAFTADDPKLFQTRYENSWRTREGCRRGSQGKGIYFQQLTALMLFSNCDTVTRRIARTGTTESTAQPFRDSVDPKKQGLQFEIVLLTFFVCQHYIVCVFTLLCLLYCPAGIFSNILKSGVFKGRSN